MNSPSLKSAWIAASCIFLCLLPLHVSAAQKTLKITLLPIIDSFPFHVAEAEGLFRKNGVEVQLIGAASGLSRDQLMQAGEVDGMLNEMHSTASFNRNGARVMVLAEVRRSHPGHPLFRVLAAPKSGLSTLQDLKGVPTAVSKNTIIEYVAHRLFTEAGLKDDEIALTSVPSIPERFQLLMQGKLKAAVLPEPLASGAIKAGAMAVADDAEHPLYAVSVLSFSKKAVQEKQPGVLAFLKAWDEAAALVNKDPEKYRELLIKTVRMPPSVQQSYAIPPFSRGRVPGRDQWGDVQEWMVEKGLLKAPVDYDASVTGAYLP